MAVVYRAFDEHLRVARAVKLLVPAAARLPEARSRLETEARAMATLAHPNVAAVYDIRKDDKELFLVMELIEGGTLWDWVRVHGPMPPRLAIQVMLPVLDAVGAAHEAGVIHRDLKPQNIMLSAGGEPKVTDFGIAHVQASFGGTSYTRTGTVLGTWAFMAPEQRHSARAVDERSDVYALGATLYSLLTAEPPFDLFAADRDARLLAGIPQPLCDPIRTATRYDPAQRYHSTGALAEALSAALPALDEVPDGTPRLGEALPSSADGGAATAGLQQTTNPGDTDGPAADLIYGRRRLDTASLDDDALAPSGELSLLWKLVATVGPAAIAAVAGGAVMLSRSQAETIDTVEVLVTGAAAEVTLVDTAGAAWPPGMIAPGLYRIQAQFQGEDVPVDAGELDAQAGASITITCHAQEQRCAPEGAQDSTGS